MLFKSKEVLVTNEIDLFTQAKHLLDTKKIKYTTKIKNANGFDCNRIYLPQIQTYYLYYIYVDRKDVELSKYIIEQCKTTYHLQE